MHTRARATQSMTAEERAEAAARAAAHNEALLEEHFMGLGPQEQQARGMARVCACVRRARAPRLRRPCCARAGMLARGAAQPWGASGAPMPHAPHAHALHTPAARPA